MLPGAPTASLQREITGRVFTALREGVLRVDVRHRYPSPPPRTRIVTSRPVGPRAHSSSCSGAGPALW
jgi:hypothetical protein